MLVLRSQLVTPALSLFPRIDLVDKDCTRAWFNCVSHRAQFICRLFRRHWFVWGFLCSNWGLFFVCFVFLLFCSRASRWARVSFSFLLSLLQRRLSYIVTSTERPVMKFGEGYILYTDKLRQICMISCKNFRLSVLFTRRVLLSTSLWHLPCDNFFAWKSMRT